MLVLLVGHCCCVQKIWETFFLLQSEEESISDFLEENQL